jgi:hypothetical protein
VTFGVAGQVKPWTECAAEERGESVSRPRRVATCGLIHTRVANRDIEAPAGELCAEVGHQARLDQGEGRATYLFPPSLPMPGLCGMQVS